MHSAHAGAPVDPPNAISIPPEIAIRSLAPGDDTTAFRTLNESGLPSISPLKPKTGRPWTTRSTQFF